jgi:hypothetical protein
MGFALSKGDKTNQISELIYFLPASDTVAGV